MCFPAEMNTRVSKTLTTLVPFLTNYDCRDTLLTDKTILVQFLAQYSVMTSKHLVCKLTHFDVSSNLHGFFNVVNLLSNTPGTALHLQYGALKHETSAMTIHKRDQRLARSKIKWHGCFSKCRNEGRVMYFQ